MPGNVGDRSRFHVDEDQRVIASRPAKLSQTQEQPMYAMVLTARGRPLAGMERTDPRPGPGEVRVKIGACGVCRTDLHVVDGELPDLRYPIVPGHEVVGRIDALGDGVK